VNAWGDKYHGVIYEIFVEKCWPPRSNCFGKELVEWDHAKQVYSSFWWRSVPRIFLVRGFCQ